VCISGLQCYYVLGCKCVHSFVTGYRKSCDLVVRALTTGAEGSEFKLACGRDLSKTPSGHPAGNGYLALFRDGEGQGLVLLPVHSGPPTATFLHCH